MGSSGEFAWYDCMSTDPAVTRAFYTALFGWAVKEVDSGPTGSRGVFERGSTGIAGIVGLDPAAGYPTHWLSYITTPDVDAAAGRVVAHGGQVLLPPSDIPDVGRFTVATDPHGALFALIHFLAHPPRERRAAGFFCWNELLTPDEGARTFYANVFGYSASPMSLGPLGTYWFLEAAGTQQAGILHSDRAVPACWLPHVAVTDVDQMTRKARGLGATVMMGPADVPNVGRFSVIADPLGAIIALFA